MSPEPRVQAFVPQEVQPQRSSAAGTSHAAGFAAGWAAGARAASEAAVGEREAEHAEHVMRQQVRDEQVRRAVAALEAAARRLDARTVPVLLEAEDALYSAALELAEAVLGREVRPGPESARVLLDRALALPPEIDPTVIRLHPEDVAQVRALVDAGEVELPPSVTLVADPRLHHGDAITEHEDGALDNRIRGALERARAVLMEQP